MPTLHTIDVKEAHSVSTSKGASTIPLDTTAPDPIVSTTTTPDARVKFNPVVEAAALAIIDRKRPLPSPSPPKKSKKRSSIATTPHGFGPWSHEENVAFRRACLFHGIGNWKNVSKMVASRTPEQVKSHAQKMKLHHPAVWDELVKRSENGMVLSNLAWLDEFAKSNNGVASKFRKADAHRKQPTPRKTTTGQVSTEVHRTKETNTAQPLSATNTWTTTEHLAFCRACCLLGVGNWKRISELIPTRSAIQVKSHAQKVKLHRPEEWRMLELRIFEEVEHEEGRDDERSGDKFTEDTSAAVDQQLEIAGNLLLLASGDGDNSDLVRGKFPTDACKEGCDESNTIDSEEESCPSPMSRPRLREDQNVCANQAIASSSAKLCCGEMKYSRNETPRNRSVMGYDATILFGKEIAEANSGSSGVLSDGVMPSVSNLNCDASCDKIRQQAPKKFVQEAEPETFMIESQNAVPDETTAGGLVLSNETYSINKKGASSSGSYINNEDVPQNGEAISQMTKLHNPSLLTLRTILATLSSSELSEVLPSKDHQIELLRKENESLKATIEKLQLKLAMEKRRNNLTGHQAVNGTKKDASVRAGLSALKARGRKT